jgi:hypothetical protein
LCSQDPPQLQATPTCYMLTELVWADQPRTIRGYHSQPQWWHSRCIMQSGCEARPPSSNLPSQAICRTPAGLKPLAIPHEVTHNKTSLMSAGLASLQTQCSKTNHPQGLKQSQVLSQVLKQTTSWHDHARNTHGGAMHQPHANTLRRRELGLGMAGARMTSQVQPTGADEAE